MSERLFLSLFFLGFFLSPLLDTHKEHTQIIQRIISINDHRDEDGSERDRNRAKESLLRRCFVLFQEEEEDWEDLEEGTNESTTSSR